MNKCFFHILLVTTLSVVLAGCETVTTTEKATTKSEKANSTAKTLVTPHEGNLAMTGGKPTVRESYNTNNRRYPHAQPAGHFGTMTLEALNVNSGNQYPLDADVDDDSTDVSDTHTLHRLYFPKGGWIDFADCELDEDYSGTCLDENGREWEIMGEN